MKLNNFITDHSSAFDSIFSIFVQFLVVVWRRYNAHVMNTVRKLKKTKTFDAPRELKIQYLF